MYVHDSPSESSVVSEASIVAPQRTQRYTEKGTKEHSATDTN